MTWLGVNNRSLTSGNPQSIIFQDNFDAVAVGDMVSLDSSWQRKGYTDWSGQTAASVVTVLNRSQTPTALLNDPRFPTTASKQIMRFTLPSTDIEAWLLWANLPVNETFLSYSWAEYRANNNLGGEKFGRFGNFVGGVTNANRGIDGLITLGAATNTNLVANSTQMHVFPDQPLTPGLGDVSGLHWYEILVQLSTGTNADGWVELYKDNILVGRAANLQFYDTLAQAAIALQLFAPGGWSSTGGGTEGPNVKYPIVRYWCGWRVATTRQGIWTIV